MVQQLRQRADMEHLQEILQVISAECCVPKMNFILFFELMPIYKVSILQSMYATTAGQRYDHGNTMTFIPFVAS